MVENTLSVGKISEGFVLDHIEAGKSMEIYKYCIWTNWTAAWRSSKMRKAARWDAKIL